MRSSLLQPRVPARAVLGSLAALWACYFVLATARGALVGLDLDWPIVSRRLTICVLSAMVMAVSWPLLQMIERRSWTFRLTAVLAGALPLSFALALINDTIFSDLETTMEPPAGTVSVGEDGKIRITRDDGGNILVDIPEAAPPAPPAPPAQVPGAEPTAMPASPQAPQITIHSGGDEDEKARISRAVSLVDTSLGRYFLILAWAALYFALAKAEEARAAERREGEYRRAAEAAELRSLRYQVNPHFLFNTLNSLSALVMTERHDDAETMIQSLSSFYRHTLSGDPTGDISLSEEIELQQLYLKIEGVRFPNRLRAAIAVDAEAASVKVPGMILQPLVENSVKYGVAATQRPVTIGIRAQRKGEMLEVVVEDDGPDKSETAPVLGAAGCGIGLANVRDRLRARFGGRASLSHGVRAGGGYATILTIPMSDAGSDAGWLSLDGVRT
ncbi:sensor histidine kinase [Novosphingobium sp. 9]|uniref:sensor histidine kinase n=1 Tax=Novosphingobium sp. 9 TaxID=2025349 RepID=UPI0021B567E2|nr:histidine kinase [Novosphingobium sp. 9]